MGTVEQNLNNYIWNNLNELKSMFSDRLYSSLLKKKEKEDREGFTDTLELIIDLDSDFFDKIKNEYSKNLSIDEISQLLDISPYDNFVDKKQYIDRAEYWVEKYKKEDKPYALLLNNLGRVYTLLSEYDKSESLYKKALKIREEVLGENHLDTATSYNNLASLYKSKGAYAEAELLFEKALKIREEVLGKNHPDTAESYNSLAGLYYLKREYNKAEPLYKKALKIREEVLGMNHPATARSYNNLALLYNSKGEYDKAEPLFGKVLKINKEVLGENHPDTATSYNNIASLYRFNGEYDKAEPIHLKVLKIREEVLGENHLDTAESYNSLAGLYYLKREYNKAEPLYKKSLKIREEVLGENHPQTATSYNNLAEFYRTQKAYENSLLLHEKALKIREEIFGMNHPDTAGSYNNLALLYNSKGEYDKAKELYEKSLKTCKEILGENHPNTASSYNNLATLYKSKGEYNKAELLYEKALKISKDKNKLIHSNFDSFMQNLNRLFFLNSRNSNITFKIDSLEVKNFKQYKKLFSMEFSKQVNIIVGQNAIGKTTLLQAITLGLLKKNILDARELKYDKYITKNENESEIIIGHNDGREKIVKIKKDEREIDDNYFIPFVLAYGSNFFTKYDLSVEKIVDNILNETIHEEIANSIFEDYVDEFWNPLTILSELDKSSHAKGKKKRAVLFDAINDFLDGYELVKDKKSGRYFFQKENDDTPLQLEDLSEGYRGNVLLITDMVVKILGVGWTPKTIEGIILIDEFDKHLHPKWQSRLVNQLTTTFPNIQFIMTTHNPMSILDREPDEITILKEIDGEIIAVKGRGTKTIGVSVVLLEYFNVDTTVSSTMRENINNFNRLKLKKELTPKEREELKELEIFLGNTVASNIIYDRKYLKFLEFIRDHKEIDFDKYEKISDNEMDELLKDFGDFFDD